MATDKELIGPNGVGLTEANTYANQLVTAVEQLNQDVGETKKMSSWRCHWILWGWSLASRGSMDALSVAAWAHTAFAAPDTTRG